VETFGAQTIVYAYYEAWDDNDVYDQAIIARQYDATNQPVGGWKTLRIVQPYVDDREFNTQWASGNIWTFFENGQIFKDPASGCAIFGHQEADYTGYGGDGLWHRFFSVRPSSSGVEVVDEFEFYMEGAGSYNPTSTFLRVSKDSNEFVYMIADYWWTGTVQVGGFRWYGLSLNANGTINNHGMIYEWLYPTPADQWAVVVTHDTIDSHTIRVRLETEKFVNNKVQHWMGELTVDSCSNVEWMDEDVQSQNGEALLYQSSVQQAWDSSGKNMHIGFGVGYPFQAPGFAAGTIPGVQAAMNKTSKYSQLVGSAEWETSVTWESNNKNYPSGIYTDGACPNPAISCDGGNNMEMVGQVSIGGKHVGYAEVRFLATAWNGTTRNPTTPKVLIVLDTFGSPKYTYYTKPGAYSWYSEQWSFMTVKDKGGTPWVYARDNYYSGPGNDWGTTLYVAELPWASEPPPLKMTYRDDAKRMGAKRIGYPSENSKDIRLGTVAW
jgi:hypothetical protein